MDEYFCILHFYFDQSKSLNLKILFYNSHVFIFQEVIFNSMCCLIYISARFVEVRSRFFREKSIDYCFTIRETHEMLINQRLINHKKYFTALIWAMRLMSGCILDLRRTRLMWHFRQWLAPMWVVHIYFLKNWCCAALLPLVETMILFYCLSITSLHFAACRHGRF